MDWKSLLDEVETEDDWPENAQFMKSIERSLRCPICHATMKAPVILVKCGHSYCSYCIRQSLSMEKTCPLCKQPATEGDIVKNVTVGEITEVFKANRKVMLEMVQKYYTPRKSRKRANSNVEILQQSTSTSSTDVKRVSSTVEESQHDGLNPLIVIYYSADSEYSIRKDCQCECPICGEFFPQDIIEVEVEGQQHASTCDGTVHSSSKSAKSFTGFVSDQDIPRQSLPNLCYKLMKTSEIKKLLQRYSLPTSGSREQLIERHRQFTLRYNAELDTLNPLPVWKIAQMVVLNEEKSRVSALQYSLLIAFERKVTCL
ncbi:ubiquitin ligase [Blastocystis sp. subtype 4]|uniref:ubiquitin ligase n=1 Tax=Blastocystis sp. subtype 4 TaxID=944170 RepID=UPI00071182FD|nr:ubiquitin ligase [Blastocystis sp. subtype 4]KNB46842.1 ubiquitin ligase [Blastocystis sp. subtype 4]|eukprot:XP_014530285.1 ubiquitin ligase [Blastocystis sp. subtype 4]